MDVQAEAASLVARITEALDRNQSWGSMSVSIYDTAWVSMVSKCTRGKRSWLFPQSFDTIVKAQLADGGWESYATHVDGILNTGASLLALIMHQEHPEYGNAQHQPLDLEIRITRAKTRLGTLLLQWDVEHHDQVGFEILLPSLLDLLAAKQAHFDFSAQHQLALLNQRKLVSFTPDHLYSDKKSTLVHSLEAFAGKVDFNRVRHHLIQGSMMGSPSATAAYLIYSPRWSDEAERYLRETFESGSGKGSGAFPSAFPTSLFEVAWVGSTLLEAGYETTIFESEGTKNLIDHLENALVAGKGIIGFDSHVLADVDDSAKAIYMLRLCKRDVEASGMVAAFESAGHFRTYETESKSSISANCNVMIALLHQPEPTRYMSQILKCADFLFASWLKGKIRDKWNLSWEYSAMLLARSFSHLFDQWNKGHLATLPAKYTTSCIPQMLAQIASEILQGQGSNGSWRNESCEITAYNLSTLRDIVLTPLGTLLYDEIANAVELGRNFLMRNHEQWKHGSYTWTEKVTYSSSTLSECYCLAAMHHSPSKVHWTRTTLDDVGCWPDAMDKSVNFFSRLPIFANTPKYLLKVAAIESSAHLPRLRGLRNKIFSRDKMTEDKYLDYIPLTWLACNHLRALPLSPEILWEMMVVSMLNYQVDEYMESVAAPTFMGNLGTLEKLIDRYCFGDKELGSSTNLEASLKRKHSDMNGKGPMNSNGESECPSQQKDVERVLSLYIRHALDHAAVKRSLPYLQHSLRWEMARFLKAHLNQAKDSAGFAERSSNSTVNSFLSSNSSYYDWVRTTSADHTSCPYSFALFSCLISHFDIDPFPGVRQKYLAQDVCRHLATMCRQYNDYGSIERDRLENNLNSVDFVEFDNASGHSTEDRHDSGHEIVANGVKHLGHTTDGKNVDGKDPGQEKSETNLKTTDAKESLMWLAEYERECLKHALQKLEQDISAETAEAVKLFIDVTDLYGQIYVARDIASRVK